MENKWEVLRLFLFVVYANLIFPAAIRGFLRFLKYRDWALLMEPVVTLAVTDALLIHFITHKPGRKFIMDSLSALIKPNLLM